MVPYARPCLSWMGKTLKPAVQLSSQLYKINPLTDRLRALAAFCQIFGFLWSTWLFRRGEADSSVDWEMPTSDDAAYLSPCDLLATLSSLAVDMAGGKLHNEPCDLKDIDIYSRWLFDRAVEGIKVLQGLGDEELRNLVTQKRSELTRRRLSPDSDEQAFIEANWIHLHEHAQTQQPWKCDLAPLYAYAQGQEGQGDMDDLSDVPSSSEHEYIDHLSAGISDGFSQPPFDPPLERPSRSTMSLQPTDGAAPEEETQAATLLRHFLHSRKKTVVIPVSARLRVFAQGRLEDFTADLIERLGRIELG